MMVKTDGLYAYDLAEVWRAKTGLPFVFAVWAVRKAALAEMREGLDLGGDLPALARPRAAAGKRGGDCARNGRGGWD